MDDAQAMTEYQRDSHWDKVDDLLAQLLKENQDDRKNFFSPINKPALKVYRILTNYEKTNGFDLDLATLMVLREEIVKGSGATFTNLAKLIQMVSVFDPNRTFDLLECLYLYLKENPKLAYDPSPGQTFYPGLLFGTLLCSRRLRWTIPGDCKSSQIAEMRSKTAKVLANLMTIKQTLEKKPHIGCGPGVSCSDFSGTLSNFISDTSKADKAGNVYLTELFQELIMLVPEDTDHCPHGFHFLEQAGYKVFNQMPFPARHQVLKKKFTQG